MPTYILDIAVKHDVNGAIWVMKNLDSTNSQSNKTCQKAQTNLGDRFLAVYGTFRDDHDSVGDEEAVIENLHLAVYEGDGEPDRVHLCAPGLYVSAREALRKSMPLLVAENAYRQQHGRYPYDTKVPLGPGEKPPNLPDLEMLLRDGFSKTVIKAVLIRPVDYEANYKSQFYKDNGLREWVESLERRRDPWQFESTREHVRSKVVMDGSHRIHLYQLWELQRTFEDVVRTQKWLIDKAKERLDDADKHYDQFIIKATQILADWTSEGPKMKAKIEDALNSLWPSTKEKANQIVAHVVKEVAGTEYNKRFKNREITFGNPEDAVIFMTTINQSLKVSLSRQQEILNKETRRGAVDIWTYRLKSLEQRFTSNQHELGPYSNRNIALALEKAETMEQAIHDLILKKLSEVPGRSTEVTKRLDDALAKPWLAHQQAKASILGSHSSTGNKDEEIVAGVFNQLGILFRTAVSATVKATIKSCWNFLDKEFPVKVSLDNIISVHQEMVVGSWMEIVKKEITDSLIGTADTASEVGRKIVVDLLDQYEEQCQQETVKTQKAISQELLQKALASRAACLAAQGALDEICSRSAERIGNEILPKQTKVSADS